MFHAPMKNLAKTAEELKESMPSITRVMEADRPVGPVYPYGCCISLDEETMEKLDLDDETPKVGDVIHFCCMAQVRAVPGERLGEDGKPQKSGCVELQITDIGIPSSDAPRSAKWYGEPDGDEDD